MSVSLLKGRSVLLTFQALKNNVTKCCYATKDIIAELEVEETPAYEIEPKYDEEYIEQIRNKSRLWPQHRKMLQDKKPYSESYEKYHDTVWYKKKMLGKYGIEEAGIPIGICWPTKEDIDAKKEYEGLLYPNPLDVSLKQIEEKKINDAMKIRKREEEIDKVVANFDKWRVALKAKIEKKEAALQEAKMKKERMLNEMREQFGFNIDPRDERFQEMLAQKEKEDKKKKKEAKKKAKSDRLMALILQKSKEANKTESNDETKNEQSMAKETEPLKETVQNEDDSKKTK